MTNVSNKKLIWHLLNVESNQFNFSRIGEPGSHFHITKNVSEKVAKFHGSTILLSEDNKKKNSCGHAIFTKDKPLIILNI